MAMKKSYLSDDEIVLGFRNNQNDIIVAVYKIIIPNVIAFVRSRGGSRDDAEEVAWRAITKFWQRCQRTDFILKDKTTGFGAYIARAYRNIWADWHKEGQVKRKSGEINEVNQIVDNDDELPDTNNFTISGDSALDRLSADNNPEEIVAENNVKQYIWLIVEKLSTKCRDFFFLYYKEELSYEEIAERKKISEGAVRKQKSECKEPFMQELLNSPYLVELEENYPGFIKRILK